MSAQSITLSEFLNLKEQVPTKLAKARETLTKNKDKIQLKTVDWAKVEEKVLDNLCAFFDLKMLDLFLGAWKKYEELQEFADRKKHPASEENEVALLEHEITSTHHPSLEISIGKVKLGSLDFDLDVSLKIEGADLTIQNGCIKKVRLGKCQGEARLSWDKIDLITAQTKAINLGDRVSLPRPIEIGN